MSDVVHEFRPRARAFNPPEIREHRIPTPGSKPYIAMEGFDGCLWFCESGASKIGRFDPNSASFTEFELPTPNATPIGISIGGDGNYWFCEKAAHQVGRITPQGKVTEFKLPTPNAGPDGILLGTRRQRVVLRNRREPDRPHHAGRHNHRVQGRPHAGLQAAVVLRARRRAVVQRGRRQQDRPHRHAGQGHRVSDSRHTTASRARPSRIPTAASGSSRPRPTRSAASTAPATSPSIR